MHLIHPRRTLAGVLAASLLIVGALVSGPAYAAVPTTPFVSEIHYDNDGTDVDEFVEVQLPPGTTSSGLTLVLYNGSGGAAYGTLSLPAVTAPAGASAVVAVAAPGLQNGGPDGLALVDGSTVLDRLSYEGSFTAADGAAAGQTLPDIGVAELSTQPVGQSLSRRYDPATDAYVWQGAAAATRGTLNPELTPATTCDETPTHEIGAVQGSGAATPLAGRAGHRTRGGGR